MPLKQRATSVAIHLGLGVMGHVAGLSSLAMEALMWLRLRYLWLKPRPGDIYVATATKAGTTWMQQIVYQLVTRGEGEFEHIYQVSPYLDQLVQMPWAGRLLDSLPSPRILKTHLFHKHLRPPADSRVIYVTRNATDSVVSLHNHCILRDGHRPELDTDFVRGEPLVGLWFAHLESWWPHRSDPNVLHLRYEDMVSDLEGSIRRVARFLDIAIPEERMGVILEKCSFAYMKKHDARFDVRLAFFDSRHPRPTFIRKGGVGDGRTVLQPEVQAQVDERMGQLRKKLGIGETEV